ncbi:MAG: DUF1538 domain-containing protein [Bacilli bacterium]|nr:DUF1538 domain-containing protein [Bacilli bacterium]
MKKWGKILLDALLSTAPVILIVLILNLCGVAPFNDNMNLMFLFGSLLLFFGVALFSIGTENAMSKIGEIVGANMTKQKNFIALILIVFLLGIFVTIAEPDLSVLASRLPIQNYLFIALVGVGVGIFLVVGVIRILWQKSLKVWLLAFYALIFALAILVDETFVPLTFDSGGVTTGPVTVPFILALGVGIATSRAGKSSNADSFGLTAFCSIGPLLVVLIFGLFMGKLQMNVKPTNTVLPVGQALFNALKDQCINVSIAMAPIILFFFIYNAVFVHLPKKQILKIIVGLVYTYVGLVLFLTGVEGAFTPIADFVGISLANKEIWMLLLIAAVIGFVVVLCEPAVQVLVKQVEQVSDGAIKKSTMLIALSVGIALGVMLAVIRIVYNFSIFYYVVPGYILALGLTFAVPDIYVGIAFDSGGVASGPMTSAFILPFTLGVARQYYMSAHPGGWDAPTPEQLQELGNFVLTRAFGTVAMVAMMPLIVIQILGLNATLEKQYNLRLARKLVAEKDDNQIIHFGA